MSKLAGKHIVITGASAGIGAELARQLGAQGCRLTLAARRCELLQQVAEQVRQAGGQAQVAVCDVAQREQVLALAAAARAGFGEIDVWVSNAGHGIRHRVLQAAEDDMLEQYKVNCLSSLWGYQAVIPHWQDHQRSGQVIDVSSVGGKAGFPFAAGYVAAKHALSGLGDVARQELAGSGIMITTVYPGSTLSDFSRAVLDRTDGTITSSLSGIKRRSSLLVRILSAEQSSAHVARCIVGVMLRPRPTAYPHPGATFAAILNNFWPGFVLAQIVKLRRGI